MPPFTCAAACADKWLRHGPSRREDASAGCAALPAAARMPGGRDWSAIAAPVAPSQVAAARQLWLAVDAAFVAAGALDVVLPPGVRGFGGAPDVDFVAAGLRLPPQHVAVARAQWRAYAATLPPFPTGPASPFAGRGIVIVGCAARGARPAQC